MARSRYTKRDRQPSFIQQQIAEMREAMREENRNDPVPRTDSAIIHKAERLALPDEDELKASMDRLAAAGLMFAIREEPRTFRIVQSEAEKHKAIVDGLSLWSPRDMFEYLHFDSKVRETFRRFKKVFSDSSFEWKGPEEK